jgi:hypothetical protein
MEHVEPRRAEGMQKADVYFWSVANGFAKWDDVDYHVDVNERSIDISATKGKNFLPLKKEATVTVNANFGIRIGTAGLLWAVIDGRMADHGHFVLIGAEDSGRISEFQSKGAFSITSDKIHPLGKLHVIAENHAQYLDYLSHTRQDERDTVFVHSADVLRGQDKARVALYGTYYRRPDFQQIRDWLDRQAVHGA